MPLAIELMAGWVGTLSVQEILQQQAALLAGDSGGAEGEGQGLAGVMRRSYELLQPGQQRPLPVLSVFAGAFTLDDARGVSGLAGPALPRSIRALLGRHPGRRGRRLHRGHPPGPDRARHLRTARRARARTRGLAGPVPAHDDSRGQAVEGGAIGGIIGGMLRDR